MIYYFQRTDKDHHSARKKGVFHMSRRICCICLALSVLIATVSIAYADAVPSAPLTEQDYQEAVLALEEQGLQTGFASGLTSTQRLYENDLPAGGEDASITQLQFLALDEIEAELLAQQAAREQLASNLALLSQYDGVKLSGSATVYSDAGSTATSGKIESGKVARLKDIDATGRWYLVTFANMTGYISADVCTPVSYKDYDGTDAVRTRAQILARSNTAAAKAFGTGVVPGGSTLRSAVVDYAMTFMGVRYVYGGASRSGTDCSGLTMQVYGYYGISLPHGCVSQYRMCQFVSRSALQPGDMVFFSRLGHVGIYIGGGQFIHAANGGVQISSLNSSHWSSCYYGAGRIISG